MWQKPDADITTLLGGVCATSGDIKNCFLIIEKKMVGKVQSLDQAMIVLCILCI